jgi:glycosyltransferase involved in cell wall biosynthesis
MRSTPLKKALKMPIESIDYVFSKKIDVSTGNGKATLEKARQLEKIVPNFNFFTAPDNAGKGVFSALMVEMKYVIQAVLSKRQPDVIITRSSLCFGTYLVSRIRGVPLIREWHADLEDEARFLFADNLTKMFLVKILQRMQLFFLCHSDGVIFNTPQLCDYYKKKISKCKYQECVVGNGTDTAFFYPQDKQSIRQKLGLDGNARILLFLGSMNPWHGVGSLIETFREMQSYSWKDDKPLYLLLVGGHGQTGFEGYDENTEGFSSMQSSIVITGSVAPSLARDYIAASDLCLLSVLDSRVSPGSPLKLFDYAACGRPIAAQSGVLGYGDQIIADGLGLEVDFWDASVAAKEIWTFLEGESLEHYEHQNRVIAEKKYDWNSVIDRWVEFAGRVRNCKRNSTQGD